MSHKKSVARQAVEQYLLGELSEAERADFESHLFECEECADEVRLGFWLIENAKAVFHEDPRRRSSPQMQTRNNWTGRLRFASAVPVAAGLALFALAAYQNLVVFPSLRGQIANLNRPQVLESNLVIAPFSRGEAPAITLSPGASFVSLSLALGPVPSAERYECNLRSKSGQSLWKFPVARLHPGGELRLLIPVSKFAAGRYRVVLDAINGPSYAEIDRYDFALSAAVHTR